MKRMKTGLNQHLTTQTCQLKRGVEAQVKTGSAQKTPSAKSTQKQINHSYNLRTPSHRSKQSQKSQLEMANQGLKPPNQDMEEVTDRKVPGLQQTETNPVRPSRVLHTINRKSYFRTFMSPHKTMSNMVG